MYNMILRSLFSFLMILSVTGVSAVSFPPAPVRVVDISQAKEICDSLPLMPVEGIWLFPDDKVSVLLCRENSVPEPMPKFTLIVVESENVDLVPGDTIGSLMSTPKADTFALTLFTKRNKGLFSHPFKCDVKFDSKQGAMILPENKKPFRFRFNINPSSLLPGFLKLVRISVSNTEANNRQTHGMVRIYPSYDGNGSLRSQPRYL